jgi:hypothetical protein
MTTDTAPRTRTTDEIAAELGEHAQRRMGLGSVDPTYGRPAVAILREADEDRTHLGTVAEARRRVRSSLRLHRRDFVDTNLAEEQARRYGYAAMATLGSVDETTAWRTSNGERQKVGPYVSDAVHYVLRGVEVTPADRDLVSCWAALFNVSSRITV